MTATHPLEVIAQSADEHHLTEGHLLAKARELFVVALAGDSSDSRKAIS